MIDFFYAPWQWTNNVYLALANWTGNIGLPLGILQFFLTVIMALILISVVMLNVMFLTWMERKVAGHIQCRLGPMRTGPHGLLQPVADAVKLLTKEPMALPGVDNFIYFLSPMLVFTTAFLSFIVIPFSPGWVVADMNYGLLFLLAMGGLSAFFVLVGGWSSNNSYSLLGGLRAVAQIVSYEVPLVISILGVALVAGSFNLNEIVSQQASMWNIVRQPLAFLLFFTAGLAEINRAPFDLEEAEQELVAGYMTEYSGMRFAMYYLAEYTHLLGSAMIVTTLFLGGWHGPGLPPIIWFFLKTYIVAFIYMWIRWTYPRVRVDHMMQFNWKFILPLALINLGITSLIMVL